jgi:hypothetical protein
MGKVHLAQRRLADGTKPYSHRIRRKNEVRREYEQIWPLLSSRKIEDVIDPRVARDSRRSHQGRAASCFYGSELSALVICRAVNFSLERGNCDASCLPMSC